MALDVLVALLVVGGPSLAIGVLVGPLCGRGRIAWTLGPVVGLAAMVLLLRLLSRLHVDGGVKTGIVLVLGLVAAALAALQRRPLLPFLPPLAALFVVVALLAWPLAGRDGGTILGYNIINDSGYHASVSQWIADGQPAVPPGSTTAVTVSSYDNGYPAGSHELVALAIPLSPDGIWGAYQAVLAVVLGLGTFPAYWALRRVGVHPGLAALGGVLAAAGYLQYAFYSEALLPQMSATPLVFGAIGLACEGVLVRRLTPFALGAMAALAAMLTYSLGLAVYLAPVFGLALVVLVLRSPWRRRMLMSFGIAVAVLAVASLTVFRPLADQSVSFIDEARATLHDPNPAHLPGPADRRLVWGAWVGTDFRYPYERWRVTETGIDIAVLLACLGVLWCLLRRRLALLALLGAALGGYLVIRDEASIYWIAKSYQVVAYPLALCITAGAAALVALRIPRARYLGAVVAAVLLAGYGFAAWRSLEYARAGTAYSNPEITQLAAFHDAGSQGLGVGLVFDDLAKTQLRTLYNVYELTFLPLDRGYAVGRTPPTRVPDVDSFRPGFLDLYDYVVERRVGGLSQPPPPFELAAQTDDFRLWRRPAAGPLPPRRPAELPGQQGGVVVAPGASLGLADAGWEHVRVGVRPLDGWYLPMSRFTTAGSMWLPWEGSGGVHYVSNGVGTAPATYDLDVPIGGRYRVSVMGSMTPSFRLVIDGQTLTPPVTTGMEARDGGQYLGTVELAPGPHRIEVWSPDGLTRPRNISFVQAVSLELETPPEPSPVCINGRRYEAASDRPVETDADAGSVAIENCGDVPLFVDWVQSLPS